MRIFVCPHGKVVDGKVARDSDYIGVAQGVWLERLDLVFARLLEFPHHNICAAVSCWAYFAIDENLIEFYGYRTRLAASYGK
jgi:hypothetical protein